MPFDLNPVEFLRLMEMAQRREWMKGNDITQAGRPYEDMFLIVEGTAEVRPLNLPSPPSPCFQRIFSLVVLKTPSTLFPTDRQNAENMHATPFVLFIFPSSYRTG